MRVLAVLIGCALCVVSTSVAHARPHTTLVLPLDGNTDPALRAQLNASIEKLARNGGGKVTVGDTTFAETAAAVGCDPAATTCAEMVRSTLGVDELVYGTATTTNDQTTVVVRRASAKEPPYGASIVVTAQDPPDRAEARLAPVFAQGDTSVTNPDQPPLPEQPGPPGYPNGKRTRGIIFASAGGVSLIIGLALWSNKSSVQDDIDTAPTQTAADFARLEELERRATKYAWFGNVMVVGGLALAGYGGWILYQDRQERRIAVTPTVTPTSAGVAVGGWW